MCPMGLWIYFIFVLFSRCRGPRSLDLEASYFRYWISLRDIERDAHSGLAYLP